MAISPEVQDLITRARERMAEQDAHDVKQREAGYTIDGRHPEFCGAFRELLDMLIEEIEREANPRPLLHLTRHDLAVLANSGDAEALAEWQAREAGASSVHDWDAEAAERERYADVMAADLADQQRMDRDR